MKKKNVFVAPPGLCTPMHRSVQEILQRRHIGIENCGCHDIRCDRGELFRDKKKNLVVVEDGHWHTIVDVQTNSLQHKYRAGHRNLKNDPCFNHPQSVNYFTACCISSRCLNAPAIPILVLLASPRRRLQRHHYGCPYTSSPLLHRQWTRTR